MLIIDAGRLIYDGPIETIKQRFGKYREITFETLRAAAPPTLPHGAETTVLESHRLTVRFDRTATTASEVAAALMSQVEVRDFSLSEPDLASIIMQIYNGALGEPTA